MRISDWSSDVCSSDLVRRRSAAVGRRRRLYIRERRREVVRGRARPLEHLALVIGAVGDGVLGGDRLHLVLGVAEVGEVAEGDVLQRVAGRAHLAIDLQTALKSMAVVGDRKSVA